MNPESNKSSSQTANKENESVANNSATDGSNQNRSGIMDNNMGKSDDIFEDQNVPSEGEVGNTGNKPVITDDETELNQRKDLNEGNGHDDEDDDMEDGEVDEADEDFDSIENDRNDTDLDVDIPEDLDDKDDVDEDEDDPLM